jgi:type IV fimbrial biogenesis protein FimT
MTKSTTTRLDKGLTLIELLVAIVVISILLAIGIPSMMKSLDKSRLVGAAENLMSQMRYMQAESIKSNKFMYLIVKTGSPNTSWCYGLSDESNTCDCTDNNPSCTVDGTTKIFTNTDYRGITITHPTEGSDLDFSFLPKRGTFTSDNVEFTSAYGMKLKIKSAGSGRVRFCSPDGSAPGYPTDNCS